MVNLNHPPTVYNSLRSIKVLIISAVDDAKTQLERRFELVAGVAQFAFNTSIISFGYIFIPYVPSGFRTLYGPGENIEPLSMTINPRNPAEEPEDPGWKSDIFGSQVTDLKAYTVIEVLDPATEYQRKKLE